MEAQEADFIRDDTISLDGTCKIGELTVAPKQLIQTLGLCEKPRSDQFALEFIEQATGHRLCIYDWKLLDYMSRRDVLHCEDPGVFSVGGDCGANLEAFHHFLGECGVDSFEWYKRQTVLWSEKVHHIFPPPFQRAVRHLLGLELAMRETDLPKLPKAIWLHIITLLPITLFSPDPSSNVSMFAYNSWLEKHKECQNTVSRELQPMPDGQGANFTKRMQEIAPELTLSDEAMLLLGSCIHQNLERRLALAVCPSAKGDLRHSEDDDTQRNDIECTDLQAALVQIFSVNMFTSGELLKDAITLGSRYSFSVLMPSFNDQGGHTNAEGGPCFSITQLEWRLWQLTDSKADDLRAVAAYMAGVLETVTSQILKSSAAIVKLAGETTVTAQHIQHAIDADQELCKVLNCKIE